MEIFASSPVSPEQRLSFKVSPFEFWKLIVDEVKHCSWICQDNKLHGYLQLKLRQVFHPSS